MRLNFDYGYRKEFSEGQVKTATKKIKYNKNFVKIGIAIFCNEGVGKSYGIDLIEIDLMDIDMMEIDLIEID